MEEPDATLRTPEAFLLIFCFGLSIYMSNIHEFSLGLASALSGIVLSAMINSLLWYFISYSSLFGKEVINTITILSGFVFAISIFSRYVSAKGFLLWCVLTHFLLLGIFQRDQLGPDFFPYTMENPIQWAVIFIFASLLGVRRLFRAFHILTEA